MSDWEAVFRVAGFALGIRSEVGDPSPFLPRGMGAFGHPGTPEVWLELGFDEGAQADPLKRFSPPQFRMRKSPEGLAMVKRTGPGDALGFIMPFSARARLGLPDLETTWRLSEEEEGVREAVHSFLRALLQFLLLETGGTMLHAAGLDLGGKGFAFVGHTRSGKTTLARKFPGSLVLGDDLVAVVPSASGYLLFGTPWPGREGGSVSYGGLPLRAVFILRPELPSGTYRCSPGEALAGLVAEAPRLELPGEESKLLENFSRIAATIPICKLSVGLEEDVIKYIESFF
ncbi:MAG: hypothetical protein ACUVRX_07365 [Actinomycetota bacterium]